MDLDRARVRRPLRRCRRRRRTAGNLRVTGVCLRGMATTVRWDAPREFDDFIRARHAALLRFAHVLSGDPHQAADLVQDSLERTGLAWRRLRRDNPEAYVRRVIVNTFINGVRRLRRERLTAEPPERAYDQAESRDEALWQLLSTLPPRQRAVVVLRFYADLSEVEISAVLGCTVGTVKSTSSRALAKLRTALSEQSSSEGGGDRG
jgi:RNA polymerase sigma-70 factor (sigma-E family)